MQDLSVKVGQMPGYEHCRTEKHHSDWSNLWLTISFPEHNSAVHM